MINEVYLRLPLSFEPALLRRDLDALLSEGFTPHFNTQYYQGDWSALPLRSIEGKIDQIYPDPTKSNFEDTIYLHRSPYFQEVLATLKATVLSARLLRLGAGSTIKKHKDYNLGFEDGEVRIHVPIVTNPEIEFILNGDRLTMLPGEAWYLNVNFDHSVANPSGEDRIHLVFDCVVNEEIRSLFEIAQTSSGSH